MTTAPLLPFSHPVTLSGPYPIPSGQVATFHPRPLSTPLPTDLNRTLSVAKRYSLPTVPQTLRSPMLDSSTSYIRYSQLSSTASTNIGARAGDQRDSRGSMYAPILTASIVDLIEADSSQPRPGPKTRPSTFSSTTSSTTFVAMPSGTLSPTFSKVKLADLSYRESKTVFPDPSTFDLSLARKPMLTVSSGRTDQSMQPFHIEYPGPPSSWVTTEEGDDWMYAEEPKSPSAYEIAKACRYGDLIALIIVILCLLVLFMVYPILRRYPPTGILNPGTTTAAVAPFTSAAA